MSIVTTLHLNFRGQAREALEFYRSVFGGDLQLVTFGQLPDPAETEAGAHADEIKWGGLISPDGFRIMAFDVPSARPFNRGEDSFYVSVRGTDTDEVSRCFAGLADGGTVRTALGPAPFSPLYGMVTDRFGITWIVDIAVEYAG